MKYFKRLFKSLIPVFKYLVFSYLVIFISYVFFYVTGNDVAIKSIFDNIIYVLSICSFIYSIYLSKKYKISYRKPWNLIILSMLGIGLACFCNMIILSIRVNTISSFSKILLIIAGIIMGPLSEEIVFRGILLDDLSKYNNKFIAILLGSFIFGILHRDLISMIYAFIFGIVTGIVYLKDRNLTNCILIHASGNFIVLLLTGYNIYILLLSFILLIISVFIIKRDYLLK